METEQLCFASALQHSKACIGRDEILLRSKQVNVLNALLSGQRLLCVVSDWLCLESMLPVYQLLPFLFDHVVGLARGSSELAQ